MQMLRALGCGEELRPVVEGAEMFLDARASLIRCVLALASPAISADDNTGKSWWSGMRCVGMMDTTHEGRIWQMTKTAASFQI